MLIRGVRVVGYDPAPFDIRLEDGRIASLGSHLPDSGDEVIAGEGRWLVPGLWDAHVHFTQWVRSRQRLDLSRADGPDAVLAQVAVEGAARSDPGSIIVGFGFRTAAWSRPGTTAELDAVTADHPTILISGDMHCGWLNSAAARAVGMPPPDGLIAEQPWYAVLPALTTLAESPASLPDAIAAAAQAAAALGIVGIVDLEMTNGWVAWPQWHETVAPGLRVRTAVYPDRLDEVLALGLRTGTPLTEDGLVTMGPLKIISDGSLNTRTAFCHAPYADDPAGGRGQPNYAPDQIAMLLTTAREHGLQVALHAIGDAAIGVGLDAYASTGASGSIEHAQLIDRDDIARMAKLDVTASVQPAHLLDDRDVIERCWPDRADRCFAFRSMLDAGVRLALGSDAPVSPLDPWLAMAAAVYRTDHERPPWHPVQTITAAQALAASTDGQRVRIGDRADLVLLDADPLRDLRHPEVAATLVDGQLVFDALG